MSEMVVYSKVAVELLELIKYFDEALKKKIPKDFINKLNKVKSDEYSFSVDKSKPLEEQELLPDTFKVLSAMYIIYLSTPEDKIELLNNMSSSKDDHKEEPKSTFHLSEVKDAYEIKEESIEQVAVNSVQIEDFSGEKIELNNASPIENSYKEEKIELVNVDSIPWYKRFFSSISNWFKNILGK